MTDLDKEYRESLKVFRILMRWFEKLTNTKDRLYIISKMQERTDELKGDQSNG